jgi:hypothetical protein
MVEYNATCDGNGRVRLSSKKDDSEKTVTVERNAFLQLLSLLPLLSRSLMKVSGRFDA